MIDMDTGKEVKVRVTKVENVKDVSRGLVFQRAEFKILQKIPMFIPIGIEKAIIGLNEKFPGVEFSIFGKGVWNPDEEHLEIQEEFVIPSQEVSGAHIEYLEDPGIEFDAVIHKHPSGCHSFSPTDWEFINANMRHSALWCDGKFWEATTSIFYEPYDSNIRMQSEVFTEETRGVVPDGALDKIKLKEVPRKFHVPGIGGPYRPRNSVLGGTPVRDKRIASLLGIPDFDGTEETDDYTIQDLLGSEITDEEAFGGYIDDSDDETVMGGREWNRRGMANVEDDFESMQAAMKFLDEQTD